MGLVGPEAADCKAMVFTLHQCSISLVFLGPLQEPWSNCYCILGRKRPAVEWWDMARHWGSSQHLAFTPKEIPTPKDFGMNIEYFKMETNQVFKAVFFFFFPDDQDSELIGDL